jgi:hypothetical protein
MLNNRHSEKNCDSVVLPAPFSPTRPRFSLGQTEIDVLEYSVFLKILLYTLHVHAVLIRHREFAPLFDVRKLSIRPSSQTGCYQVDYKKLILSVSIIYTEILNIYRFHLFNQTLTNIPQKAALRLPATPRLPRPPSSARRAAYMRNCTTGIYAGVDSRRSLRATAGTSEYGTSRRYTSC